MPPQTRHCECCRQQRPAGKFLPSSLSPTGYLTKCLDCIRKTAEEHRQERARVAATSDERDRRQAALTAKPVDLAKMRPVRLPPALYAAAERFVFDFRDGRAKQIQGEMEPELYALLEWLAEQAMAEAEGRR